MDDVPMEGDDSMASGASSPTTARTFPTAGGSDPTVLTPSAQAQQVAEGGADGDGDDDMEGTTKSVAEVADDIVFTLLKEKVPEVLELHSLGMDEEDAKTSKLVELTAGLRYSIRLAYGYEPVRSKVSKVASEVASKAALQIKDALGGTASSSAGEFGQKLREQLQHAFTKLPYIGGACDELAAYLQRCWLDYQVYYNKYKSPYTAIVQSSGFGKSRLLRQLAEETNKPAEVLAQTKHNRCDMRVLYICTRNVKFSTGYPVATVKLREWLFRFEPSVDNISRRLQAAYHYAQDNWANVGEEWLELFTKAEADEAVRDKLEETAVRLQEKSGKSAKKAARGTSQAPERVLILAVDEARALLQSEHNGTSHFRLLRNALTDANQCIHSSSFPGGIFAVLVDTNSKVSDFTPPPSLDPSSRRQENEDTALFPPFVLSHTMDVYWNHRLEEEKTDGITAYKSLLARGNGNKAWLGLISMGRPMWASTFLASIAKIDESNKIATRGSSGSARRALSMASYEGRDDAGIRLPTARVLDLARRKLLLGCNPEIETSFKRENMFGVASMLCRLGLRPYTASPLASRVVADFMAILAYVKHNNEGVLSTYASDPVLALGATHVWYALDSALPKYILPQLEKLLLNEVLDAGAVGEVVARIVLLLAMDTCVVKKTKATNHSTCQFKGQFVSVLSFLKALGGAEPKVMTSKQSEASDKIKDSCKVWQSQWGGWELGFCHFVQLDVEPTEEILWYLLGRRAAGMFPRNQKGADLVIPMYRKSEVSMILIQVKNVETYDGKFPRSAKEMIRPKFVFKVENPLHEKLPGDVISIYMSLREPVPDNHPARFFLAEGKAESQPSSYAFTLCIRSVGPWNLVAGRVTHPVISEAVAKKLTDLASSLWDPLWLVNSDLRERDEDKVHGPRLSTVMPNAKLVDVASRVLEHPPRAHKEANKEGSSTEQTSAAGASEVSAKRRKGQKPSHPRTKNYNKKKKKMKA